MVTVSDRLALHSRLSFVGRRVILGDSAHLQELQAVRAATYWESFPHSYSAEQVAAAVRLHVAWRGGFDSESYRAAVRDVLEVK